MSAMWLLLRHHATHRSWCSAEEATSSFRTEDGRGWPSRSQLAASIEATATDLRTSRLAQARTGISSLQPQWDWDALGSNVSVESRAVLAERQCRMWEHMARKLPKRLSR